MTKKKQLDCIKVIVGKQEDLRVSSRLVAHGIGIQHHKAVELIRKYEQKFNNFSPRRGGKSVSIPVRKFRSTGGRPAQEYLLTEEQATFLITLSHNTEKAVEFKYLLTKEFYRMRRKLTQLKVEKQEPEAQVYEKIARESRKALNDTIKKFVDYAKEQGSHNAGRYYTIFAKLITKAVCAKYDCLGAFKVLMPPSSYALLLGIETVIKSDILNGMRRREHYKQIYSNCKRDIKLHIGETS